MAVGQGNGKWMFGENGDVMRRKQNDKGFTLIELLVVIAIIGILAAIAIPLYRQYTIKAKLVEVSNSMSHVASAVVTYYQENNTLPTSLDKPAIRTTLGVGMDSVRRIGAVDVTNGFITVTVTDISAEVNNSTLTLSPIIASDGSVGWSWGGNVKNAYLPQR